MRYAITGPEHKVSAGPFSNKPTEMLVRHKDNSPILRQRVYHFNRISTGAAIIALGLDFRGTVHIADHKRIGMFLLQLA
jgi:hypothetical protein